MARWSPGARDRLKDAAMDLFVAGGFERTTAADIARSVGLTERTFFRHFADKREVLFDGQAELLQALVDGVRLAPEGSTTLGLVRSCLSSSAAFFPDERRPHSRRRQAVIDANAALQEREQLKFAQLATAVGTAMRERGVPEPAATLAAESAVTVLGVAFSAWLADGEERSFGVIADRMLDRLRETVAGTA